MNIMKYLFLIFVLIFTAQNIKAQDTTEPDSVSIINYENKDGEKSDKYFCHTATHIFYFPLRLIEQPKVDAPMARFNIFESEKEKITLSYDIKPFIALKTNLLYDLATAVNIEIEVPIGDRWSVAGEWIFPWWVFDNGKSDSRRDRFQILNANFEGRYWFGERSSRELLTGWFAGVYVGVGDYDLEHDKEGIQGEFLFTTGLSGGYSHPIGKHLRLEYGLSLGYLRTKYRKYTAYWGEDSRWHPIRTSSGYYSWTGPTRARVSLVWLINHKVWKGEIR